MKIKEIECLKMTDVEKVAENSIFIGIGDYHFTLYADNITDNTKKKYIYIEEKTGEILRDPLKGFLKISSAKKTIMRDLASHLRDNARALKELKKRLGE